MEPSKPVQSSQTGVHLGLAGLVRKHLHHRWDQPIHPGSQSAFDDLSSWLQPERPLILDSGCGTGHSSVFLADAYPQAQVIGVDQSAARLARAPLLPSHVRLIRARAEDIWRLLKLNGVAIRRHYLLYPNPWPKPGHLVRRWHAHPAFPNLLALGGELELRCNWKIYAEEFHAALRMCDIAASPVVSFMPNPALSLFERKYARSGHMLYRLTANLSHYQSYGEA